MIEVHALPNEEAMMNMVADRRIPDTASVVFMSPEAAANLSDQINAAVASGTL